MRGWIKVCGLTNEKDVELCIEHGASAIGINFWPKSPRALRLEQAKPLFRMAESHCEMVAVVVDPSRDDIQNIIDELNPHYIQLHGDEPNRLISDFSPRCFKAIGLGDDEDVIRAVSVPGPLVLVDAKDLIQRGGTGEQAPQVLVRRVCARRPTVVAGGLNPNNVSDVIAEFSPFGVDVASGVEREPRLKNAEKVKQFIRRARRSFEMLSVDDVPSVQETDSKNV